MSPPARPPLCSPLNRVEKGLGIFRSRIVLFRLGRASFLRLGRSSFLRLGRASFLSLGRASFLHLGRSSLLHLGCSSFLHLSRSSFLRLGRRSSFLHLSRSSCLHLGCSSFLHLSRSSCLHFGRASLFNSVAAEVLSKPLVLRSCSVVFRPGTWCATSDATIRTVLVGIRCSDPHRIVWDPMQRDPHRMYSPSFRIGQVSVHT